MSLKLDRFTSSGGYLVGKANMDEFAMGSTNLDSYYGPVKNPSTAFEKLVTDDFNIAGGSSGGCAVAVREKVALV